METLEGLLEQAYYQVNNVEPLEVKQEPEDDENWNAVKDEYGDDEWHCYDQEDEEPGHEHFQAKDEDDDDSPDTSPADDKQIQESLQGLAQEPCPAELPDESSEASQPLEEEEKEEPELPTPSHSRRRTPRRSHSRRRSRRPSHSGRRRRRHSASTSTPRAMRTLLCFTIACIFRFYALPKKVFQLENLINLRLLPAAKTFSTRKGEDDPAAVDHQPSTSELVKKRSACCMCHTLHQSVT